MDDLKEDWFVRNRDSKILFGYRGGNIVSIMKKSGADIVFSPRDDLKYFRRLTISAASREAIALAVEIMNENLQVSFNPLVSVSFSKCSFNLITLY